MDHERVVGEAVVTDISTGERIESGWHDGPLGGQHPHLVRDEQGWHADDEALEMAREHAEQDVAEAARLRDLAAHEAAAATDTEAADEAVVDVPVQRRPEGRDAGYGPDEEPERIPVERAEPVEGVDHGGVIPSGGQPDPNEPWGAE